MLDGLTQKTRPDRQVFTDVPASQKRWGRETALASPWRESTGPGAGKGELTPLHDRYRRSPDPCPRSLGLLNFRAENWTSAMDIDIYFSTGKSARALGITALDGQLLIEGKDRTMIEGT